MEFIDLYNKLEQDRHNWKTEEEVRKDWLKHLENTLKIKFTAERSRNDASYNPVIIEFKNKGFFNGKEGSPKYREAIYERLKPYIIKKAKNEGLSVSEYTGIATDGDHIVFAYVVDNEIYPQDFMPYNEASITKVALSLKYNKRRALTTENLIEDFGHYSLSGIQLMQALSNELTLHFKDISNNKIKMLFEEWRTLFGQIANLSSAQISQIKKVLQFPLPQIGRASIPGVLFVIHTYNALIMKLLGAEIVSYYGLTQYKDFCENLAVKDDNTLLLTLKNDIERSHLFDRIGIKGFVEEAIFSWYLDATENGDKKVIIEALRKVLIRISLYRIDNLTAARSRDVLKGFYQSLVPDTMRKSLGEFYTPDWLVDITTEQADVQKWLSVRVLDPTCGSGSFLLNIIYKKRKEAAAQGWSQEKTLNHLLENVWGFDLNPLAVQSARVNFLIAIADLFGKCKSKAIELPILLADSVYSPTKDPNKNNKNVVYRIGSTYADLLIILPAELAFDRAKLDKVFEQMGDSVDENKDYDEVEKHLLKKNILTEVKLQNWRKELKVTYDRVLKLHKNNWNGIWLRIVRNFFWSATAGNFDLILGNPPWVRWSSLHEEYREKIKPTCEQYEIFSDTPFYGGNELDISGMITYTVADKWLKENGKLVFVITQSHFQAPSSQGFRSFIINNEYSLQPMNVEDLKELKPFYDAANKTAIATFKKVKKMHNTYPVPYNVWKNKKGFSKTLPDDISKKNILKRVDIFEKEANPVDGLRSPWAIMLPNKFEKTNRIRGVSNWVQGRKGITADLNAIYFVSILDHDIKNNMIKIQTRPQAGKKTKHLKAKKYWIEPDLLYPLIKGAGDFSKCFFCPKDELYTIVPNKGITKKFLMDAEDNIEYTLHATRNFFKEYKDLLKNRSTYKARLSKYAYYMIYNVGEYTFSPYKVVWAEQSGKFKAAVISGSNMPINGYRSYIPDHKIYFVNFENKNEAYYLCGLLTAPLVCEFIESHTINIQVSNIFKHLKLPKYQNADKQHNILISLVEKAHKQLNPQKRNELILKIGELGEKIIMS